MKMRLVQVSAQEPEETGQRDNGITVLFEDTAALQYQSTNHGNCECEDYDVGP